MLSFGKSEKKKEGLYLLLLFLFYLLWACSMPGDYAPDEYMRYEVSGFLYEHNRLPVYEEQLNREWGFSYAHMPTVLCNLLSYIPMKIAGIFTEDAQVLLRAARIPNVFCGVAAIFFLMKTADLLFEKHVKWMVVIFISMLPQYAFLASYLNNDMPAILGSSIILYAWIRVMKEKWNQKNALLLAIGIIICALSYYNSYGWILCSMIFFVSTCLLQNKRNYKEMLKLGAFIASVVLCGISYSFIRQIVLYGDLLGLRTQDMYGALYGLDKFKGHPFLDTQVSLYTMLFKAGWVQMTVKSFLACFGYLVYKCPDWVYYMYIAVFVCAVLGFFCYFVKMWKSAGGIQKIFELCILVNIMIPVILSIYYSYYIDYQAQGRYLYPGIMGIAYVLARGFEKIIGHIKKPAVKHTAVCAFCAADIAAAVMIFALIYLPTVN